MNPISLPSELAQAVLGAIIAGMGTFAGALTATTASDTRALTAAGIAAGFTALTFFSNSLRNWYSQQQPVTPPAPPPRVPVPPSPASVQGTPA